MKILLIALALVINISPCFAGQKVTRVYDSSGNFIGSVRETDYGSYAFDKKGKYVGHSSKNIDGTRSYWSRDNKYLGYESCTGECKTKEDSEDE